MTDQRTQFDTKIVVVLRHDVPTWQQLNATAFLASGVATTAVEAIGEHYADADGTKYAPMFGQPVMVYAADAPRMTRTLDRALSRGLMPAVFTADLFSTGHDAANRAAVASTARANLDLVGLAVRGERKTVDKVVDGLRLYS
ncbi:DUF2000 family protein [Mycobacterium sp. WMMD1722]|uniref:DUF2000 family protein n=1 Tax=Mycobacterium sp. WMMD1722 TaxID=3404117 RepID=UPI003BF48945